MNPFDVAITNDQFPFRRLRPPAPPAGKRSPQLYDGTRRYLAGPPAPYGTLADLVPVPDAAAFPVPPGLAAALRVAGMAGWAALDYRGHLRPGETVLIPWGRRHSGPARGASRPAPRRRPGCRGRPREGPQASR